jgi:hypothetical protein
MNSKVSVIGILCGLFLTILLSNGVSTAGEIENLVQNPDFEMGVTGWTIGCLNDGAAGSLEAVKVNKEEEIFTETGGVTGNCIYAKIDGLGNDEWEPEIHSPNFGVKAGKIYTLCIWAKTEKEKIRQLSLNLEASPGGVCCSGFGQKITVTDQWTEFWSTGSVPLDTVVAWYHIAFNIGGSKDDVWLDHARAYEGKYEKEKVVARKLSLTPKYSLATTWASIKAQ